MTSRKPRQLKETVYADTPRGALACLRDISNHDMNEVHQIIPDPTVPGVWMVKHDDFSSIVYLAGYRDAFGQLRTVNDFETAD